MAALALKRNRLNEHRSLRSPVSSLFFFPSVTAAPRKQEPIRTRPSASSTRHSAALMEQFPDRHHVWLRSRVHGTYLHADADGRGVSLRPRRASRNAAWGVHVQLGDGTYVLLHSAAYGRYLAATDVPAPVGHRGFRVAQGCFNEPEVSSLMWEVVGSGPGEGVMLRHVANRFLRANGRYLRWNTGVSVDNFLNYSSMMYWMVEPIPPRVTMPPLPGPRQRLHGLRDLAVVLRLAPAPARQIRYVRANPDGAFAENAWATFEFRGRSVFRLRSEVAGQVGEIMCVRAGLYGRLTPLIVDLPSGTDPIDIVIITAGSLADQRLQHPDVDAV